MANNFGRRCSKAVKYGSICGVILALIFILLFGVFRVHEGTRLCDYLLCIESPVIPDPKPFCDEKALVQNRQFLMQGSDND